MPLPAADQGGERYDPGPAKALDEGSDETAFMEAKLLTARHFALGLMPDAGALRRKLQAGAETIMAMPADAFARA